jgi:hypothetical protein
LRSDSPWERMQGCRSETSARENGRNGRREATAGWGTATGHGGPTARSPRGTVQGGGGRDRMRGEDKTAAAHGSCGARREAARAEAAERWRRRQQGVAGVWMTLCCGRLSRGGQLSRVKEKNLATMHLGIVHFTTSGLVYSNSVAELVGYPRHEILCRHRFLCRRQDLIFLESGEMSASPTCHKHVADIPS